MTLSPLSDRAVDNQKTVLITGCSSGFGKLLVRAFLQNGWRVVATMRRADTRIDLFSDEIQRYGNNLVVETLDVTYGEDRDAITKKIDEIGNKKLDCLINNAGYALFGALEDCSDAQLREQYDVNLVAPVLLTKAMLPYLRASKGSVINISSIMSFVGFPMSSAYCSSKAGLSMMSESLKHELEPLGLRIHSLEPGGFRTGFADNSQWGNGNSEAYTEQTSRFHQLQNKLGAGEGKDPGPVIERVLSLANGGDGALRNPVGRDAWVSNVVQKTLPNEVRLKVMCLMFKRLFH